MRDGIVTTNKDNNHVGGTKGKNDKCGKWLLLAMTMILALIPVHLLSPIQGINSIIKKTPMIKNSTIETTTNEEDMSEQSSLIPVKNESDKQQPKGKQLRSRSHDTATDNEKDSDDDENDDYYDDDDSSDEDDDENDDYYDDDVSSDEDDDNQELSFGDLELEEFIHAGSINAACYVTLPDWWYEKYDIDDEEEEFILKFTSKYHEDSAIEIYALNKLWSDKEKAKRLKITPLILGVIEAPNPYYNGLDKPKDAPADWTPQEVNYLQRGEEVTALVVPYIEKNMIDNIDSLARVKVFMRSLLETFEYSHSLGVTMHDLSNSNVYYDVNDDKAIIIDWNGGAEIGEEIYIPDANFYQTPPEAMIEHVNGTMIKQTSIWAFDVWSSGIILEFLLNKGTKCHWANPATHGKRAEYPQWHDYLQQLVLTIGGDVEIPISEKEGDVVDLALLVGLNSTADVSKNRNSTLPIFKKDADGNYVPCVQSSGLAEDQKNAMSLLRSMMVINPSKRPDCTKLLEHPFLQF